MNLDHFDTILAFAAIMAGLSLVILAMSQAVSGLLGLRGFNLKWGLEKLFGLLSPGLEPQSEALARHVLLHPIMSDSSFSGMKKLWTWWRYASHIRVEELVGLLSAWRVALELPSGDARQRRTRDQAIKSLNLQPLLDDRALELYSSAVKQLEQAHIPWDKIEALHRSRLVQAFRLPAANEVEKAARTKAILEVTNNPSFPAEFAEVLCSLTIGQGAAHLTPAISDMLPAAVRRALAMPVSTEPERVSRAKALQQIDLTEAFVQEAAERLKDHLQRIEDGVEEWFETGMARISQRFSSNMRVVTIAGAVVVSLLLVVDSIDLWKQLSRRPELRNKVIASSEALLKKADELQAVSTNPPAAVYRVAATQLLAMYTNDLSRLSVNSAITNLASGTNWVAVQCKAHGVTNVARWQQEYQALIPQVVLRQAANNLQSVLEDQLALGVISSRRDGEPLLKAVGDHFGGILLTVVLLSLGAPFWFNLLRSMSNLRPILATKESQEQQARIKATAGAQSR